MEKFQKEETEETGGLQRNLTLFDLLCVGVGGTIGTGIFVLTGTIFQPDMSKYININDYHLSKG